MTELPPLAKLEDRQSDRLNWVDPKQARLNLRRLQSRESQEDLKHSASPRFRAPYEALPSNVRGLAVKNYQLLWAIHS